MRFGDAKGEQLFLLCGVCNSQLETAARALGERQNLAKDFHDAHQVCRQRGPWPGEEKLALTSEAPTRVTP